LVRPAILSKAKASVPEATAITTTRTQQGESWMRPAISTPITISASLGC